MFNPEMMKMASEMMSKMTPEQLAAMQRQAASMDPGAMQQAMRMAQNMTPEQMRAAQQQAASLPPEEIARRTAGMDVGAAVAGQQQYEYNASMQLKNEGNKLHGSGDFREAAAKYQRALSNLEAHTTQQAAELRTSCRSNLASCHLQLQEWDSCVQQCALVLEGDSTNRKALYRRGQALHALGRHAQAVPDLQKALLLSPEAEKALIGEKLDEARQGAAKQAQHAAAAAEPGLVIEEVIEEAEGKVEEAGTDDDLPPLEPPPAYTSSSGRWDAEPAAPAPPAAGVRLAAPAADQMRAAQEMLQRDPSMVRQAADAVASMSSDQLAGMMASSGMPGITPEMAKMAASMMKSMPAEQLQALGQQAARAAPLAAAAAAVPASRGSAGAPAAVTAAAATPAAVTRAAAPADAAVAAVPTAPAAGEQAPMRQMVDQMKQNPDMMKSMVQMLETMPPEQLESMAANMPGAPPGMKIDAEQMRMAAKMMEGMSPEDFESMTQMAASMGGGGGAGLGGGAAGLGGGAGGFDPSSFSMEDMRKRMQDPAVLRVMQNAVKSMDPEAMASIMRQAGKDVTPEQAKQMIDTMGGVSDRQLELLSKVMAFVNAVVDLYQRMRAWVAGRSSLVAAVLVLLLALLLRWRGWV